MTMMNQLELEKEKSVFYLRFNENHGADGKFASGGGSGGSSGSNGEKIKQLEEQMSKLSRFGEGGKKRKELQKQIDELKAEDKKPDVPKENKPEKSESPVKTEQIKQPQKQGNPVTKEKEEQYEIIKKANPMTDEQHTGIRDPSDIKSAEEAFKTDVNDDEDFLYPDFTPADAQKALDTGKITVYSSKPIEQGGFISPSKQMAQDYAGGGKVYSKEVGVNDIAWIDSNEGQMAKRSGAIMNKGLERRAYEFDVIAEKTEKGAVITGRPIVYDSRTNIGLFDEIIESKALANTDLTDVRFLVNHDISKIPLARSRRNNGNSTMKLIPDDKGLSIEVQLDVENNSEARSLYSAVKRGDISGMSFLFSVPKGGDTWENFDSDHPTRRVRSIGSVVEVSAVTFPAYEATEIQARSKEALENAKLALDSAKRSQQQLLENKSKSDLELAKVKFEALLKVR